MYESGLEKILTWTRRPCKNRATLRSSSGDPWRTTWATLAELRTAASAIWLLIVGRSQLDSLPNWKPRLNSQESAS